MLAEGHKVKEEPMRPRHGSFTLPPLEFETILFSAPHQSKPQHSAHFLGVAMQNRYVGDLGDFGKYGLLRWLCLPGRTVLDQDLSPSLGWPTVVDNHEGSASVEGSTIPFWPSEEVDSNQ